MTILRCRWLIPLTLVVGCSAIRADRHEATGHQAHEAPATAASMAPMDSMASMDHSKMTGAPAGYAPIHVDADRARAIGLASVAVADRPFTKTLRTVGVIALDETRSAHVHPKVRGWIDGIRANYVGQSIRQGQPLCSIYSQDVYSAELEYLAIVDRASGGSATGEFAVQEKNAQQSLREAAKRRLLLWDVPQSEVARLDATREPSKVFPLLSPRSGIIVAKEAIEGMYVDPSLELYTLSDLSHVWALADVYEADVPFVHVGDTAKLHVEGVADPLDARVSFLPPTIDEATRTLKARFELDNKDRRLKPGAFVSVEMDLAMGHGLGIPENTVIRTGARAIVFVVHEHEGGAHIEPREVVLGPLVGEMYRVDSGLASGDRVASGAQFLLDSESRLRATSAPMGGHVH